PDVLLKVFDPFFTTKEIGKGTGLGLSITLGIIRSHGGRITVENGNDGGAVVNVFLPFSADKESVEDESADEDIARGTETVLIVDDEAALIEVAVKILVRAGYTALTADGGAAAIRLFEDNKDKIDLVVLDMVMPEIGAKEVLKAIRKIRADVKVVLSSGHSIDGQAGELLADGIRGFVQKPYTMVEMCKAVREALDS
ncbi:MAG: response regulator, partial [bacterium]